MNMLIRNVIQQDRAKLMNMVERIKEFDADDHSVVQELLDIYLEGVGQKDYYFVAAEGENEVVTGFACYGPTPLTDGTYDLYWIGVDPDWAGKGVGSQILREVEERIKQAGGRLLLIETSSSPVYALTRKFYLKNNCTLAETIRDFYRPGEDRVTYVKYLTV
jgi:ribosomal protein S18 acetylase RimI-like enzyme